MVFPVRVSLTCYATYVCALKRICSTPLSYRLQTVRTYDPIVVGYNEAWSQCCFAAHPRQIWMATRNCVEKIDCRVSLLVYWCCVCVGRPHWYVVDVKVKPAAAFFRQREGQECFCVGATIVTAVLCIVCN